MSPVLFSSCLRPAAQSVAHSDTIYLEALTSRLSLPSRSTLRTRSVLRPTRRLATPMTAPLNLNPGNTRTNASQPCYRIAALSKYPSVYIPPDLPICLSKHLGPPRSSRIWRGCDPDVLYFTTPALPSFTFILLHVLATATHRALHLHLVGPSGCVLTFVASSEC